MIPRRLVLAVALTFPGCVSANRLNSQMATWVGANTNTVLTSMGAPSRSVDLPDGSKSLTYEFPNCNLIFGVSGENKVTSAQWLGSKYPCRKYVRHAPILAN